MTLPQIIGLASGVLLISGYIPYMYEVFKKKTIPSRMSWFIWSLSTATILFSVLGTGTTEAIWVPIADAVGCFLIFVLSLRFGVGGWSRTDQLSLAICLGSLFIWWLTGNALLALIMNLCVYVSGYIPTIKKALKKPQSESRVAWTIFFLGVLLNLFTVFIGTDTGFAVWLYPVTLVVVVGTLLAILCLKKPSLKKSRA
ncbi:hypothetical protein KBA73_05580 [Patescibacteria group bacterium]|jgi:hypothetical protein|nr:hypothetical protein [Patescibacteria group bacterium]